MKFLSVCSGIEAASVAWSPLDWKAAGFSEIEAFPSTLLSHYYPQVKNYGDMTLLPDLLRMEVIEAPDLLCGGTPCQAFSVAGLRKSLDDERGNLSLIFCEIANAIDEQRANNNLEPGIVFWENVPGVLNTKDNAFGCFLAGLAGEDRPLESPGERWTDAGYVLGPQRAVAWRILDAQYFGLAQRRRRVFVVASARDNFDPAAVLFEFDGLRRDTAPSREAGEGIASCAASSTDANGIQHTVGTLCADTHPGAYSGQDAYTGRLVPQPIAAYATQGSMIGRNDNAGPQGDGINEEVCFTQNTIDRHAVAQPMPINTMVALRHNALGEGTGFGIGDPGDMAYTITKGHSHAVAQPVTYDLFNVTAPVNRQNRNPGDPCHTLARSNAEHAAVVAQPMAIGTDCYNGQITGDVACTMGTPGSSVNASGPTVMQSMVVRRLTPIECERLQGFPDNYTNIPWRNKPEAPDGPRYKALGNSWAVPVVRWIGNRIQMHITGLL